MGRRFLFIMPDHSMAVSCDNADSFSLINLPEEYSYYEIQFVPQPSLAPLVASPFGQLYEFDSANGCPEELHILGTPLPVETSDSAAACGTKLYQAGFSRVFASSDRGQSWDLVWDFIRYGQVHLVCEAEELWAYHDGTGEVFVRLPNSTDFVEVGTFMNHSASGFQSKSLLFQGFLFVARSPGGNISIQAMGEDGSIMDFPVPEVRDYGDELLVDFEIASDGVFWLATTRAVYRDDVNEVWSKVWP